MSPSSQFLLKAVRRYNARVPIKNYLKVLYIDVRSFFHYDREM